MIKSPRCFGCSSSDVLRLIVVQGRFLALLEMTIREKRYSRIVSLLHGEAAFYLLPMEGGAPKGRRLESPRYEREYEESGLAYRHPERSRGIFAIRGQGFTLSHMCRALLRFSHLSFIPLEPYPARCARHLLHGGKLTIWDVLFFHLFSCPPGYFCFLPFRSPIFPCARKISRYARNDDMGEETLRRVSVFT